MKMIKNRFQMRIQKITTAVFLLFGVLMAEAQTGGTQWTLQSCLDYALANNISLRQNKISEDQSKVGERAAKAQLFPSLSFSTTQGLSFRPFQDSSNSYVNNGIATSTSKKWGENGSYGLNANVTVFDGGKNYKNIKAQQLNTKIAELTSATTANSIQEQIMQLFVQILYSSEAVKVNEQILATSKAQRDRGAERVKVGDLSKSDLAQLEAQVATDEYNVVNSQTEVSNYKLQLKQLLELDGTTSFDIVAPAVDDARAMAVIPAEMDVYSAALSNRPEIQSGKLSIQAADLNTAIAKAGYYPTVSLNAGFGSSHSSGTGTNTGKQMKNNTSGSLGLTVTVPIFDQLSTKSSVAKAKLSRQASALDLQDAEKKLFSTIEGYWLDATSAQKKFVAASASVKSNQSSFDLTSEQFKLGLKNIVELMTSKDNLLNALQNKLQSKYTTLLNIQLLKFYQGESMNL
jgi:outer membrane protein